MKFHFKRFSVGSLMVFFAAQLSGCSASEGIQPSAVYGSLAPERKISAPSSTRGTDLVGSVKDLSGTPIKGATIFVYTAKPRKGTSPFCPSCYADCAKHQVTSASGAFRIPSLAQDLIFRLLVVKDGFEPSFVRNVDPLKGQVSFSLKKTSLTSEQKKRLVTGRVLDPLGSPVVGALIHPFGVKTAAGASFGKIKGLDSMAITNQRGEFRFLSPSAGSSVQVRASARGLATAIFADLIAGSATPSTIDLPWGVTLRGTVTSTSGKKLSGAEVQVVQTDLKSIETFTGWMEVSTDSAGTFTLYNVPANREYKICVKMNGLAKPSLGAASQTLRTGRDDTVTDGVNLTVKPAATISGRVVLADGKKIPEGTHIILGRNGTWDAQQSILSPAGKFAFRGVPQEEDMSLSVKIPGYHGADGRPGRSKLKTRISSTETKKILSLPLTPDSK